MRKLLPDASDAQPCCGLGKAIFFKQYDPDGLVACEKKCGADAEDAASEDGDISGFFQVLIQTTDFSVLCLFPSLFCFFPFGRRFGRCFTQGRLEFVGKKRRCWGFGDVLLNFFLFDLFF